LRNPLSHWRYRLHPTQNSRYKKLHVRPSRLPSPSSRGPRLQSSSRGSRHSGSPPKRRTHRTMLHRKSLPFKLNCGTNSNFGQISANPQPNQREKPSSFNITQIPKGDSETPTTAPNGATVLYLEPESTMYKKSHIIDSHVYDIPVSQLTNFLCNKPLQNRLTKESYEALIANFKSITPRKWTKTAKLVVGERDPAPVTPPLRTATISTIPKPTPAVAPAPTLVAIPIEIQQIIIALLQFLTKEQLFEQAPELLAEYPQLLTVLA